MVFRAAPTIGLLLITISVAACSGSGAATTAANSNSDTELEALYWARQDSERMRFSQADVDFMTGMISHHAQALVMCNLAPDHGESPSVQTLCARIINAQTDEIATMQNWLRERNQTVPEVHIDGNDLMIHGGGEHAMHMPGMLTQAQIDELVAARGSEWDRLFLTYMIQHHGGATTMVEELLKQDGSAQGDVAFKVASDINVDQITEIARMKLMLAELDG